MHFIATIKNAIRSLKNRLIALPLYIKYYGDNRVQLNGARLKNVRIQINGHNNKVFIPSNQTLENSMISISASNSYIFLGGGTVTI